MEETSPSWITKVILWSRSTCSPPTAMAGI